MPTTCYLIAWYNFTTNKTLQVTTATEPHPTPQARLATDPKQNIQAILLHTETGPDATHAYNQMNRWMSHICPPVNPLARLVKLSA
jgi:hypothetical protein